MNQPYLLDGGHAQAVMELCEYAIPLLETALNAIDDSNGYAGGVLARLQELHLRACKQAKPDPLKLAERLFEFEMGTAYDTFYGAVDTYADVLGQSGLARYRELAEAAWAELPTLTPGQQPSYSSDRWRLTQIMERLAWQSGDVEAVVAIKRRDLSRSYTYLQIAELYQKAGQADPALKWAEDGLKAFPDSPDSRLQNFLVQEYQQRGRFDQAMQIVWTMFTESPSLMTYQKLKTEAERGNQWTKWREQAISHIRQQIERPKQQKQGKLAYIYRDRSLLVEIFLWEGAIELAWQEAKAGDCSKELWLKLADLCQQNHPEDSLSIYMNQIEPLIQQANNAAYAQAVDFLKPVKKLMLQLNLRSQFEQYLEHLRSTHKAKRNLMKLLNEAKL
ncbi:hypothetical protein K9N68_03945 [Kovacikia minuta CCNUW1]|uniref:tetratricopeptide repeat protein n=1 Tax=Kovacikia minuta TaxID=2931930 RepID=UPI001CCBDA47|nr:DUF6880 family protein [Kovacikia minuta]UBF27128.1 hypothetical protein K9N68_03945 [Kovacikia minuta CCNUW1]